MLSKFLCLAVLRNWAQVPGSMNNRTDKVVQYHVKYIVGSKNTFFKLEQMKPKTKSLSRNPALTPRYIQSWVLAVKGLGQGYSNHGGRHPSCSNHRAMTAPVTSARAA